MMDLIVEMRFGSHLYGTATPQSDLDLKGVYLPEARDILLQRVRGTVDLSREKEPGEKNAPGDVDREIHSLQRYLELLAEGQTIALDMLFPPAWAVVCPPFPPLLPIPVQCTALRITESVYLRAVLPPAGQQVWHQRLPGSRRAPGAGSPGRGRGHLRLRREARGRGGGSDRTRQFVWPHRCGGHDNAGGSG